MEASRTSWKTRCATKPQTSRKQTWRTRHPDHLEDQMGDESGNNRKTNPATQTQQARTNQEGVETVRVCKVLGEPGRRFQAYFLGCESCHSDCWQEGQRRSTAISTAKKSRVKQNHVQVSRTAKKSDDCHYFFL